MLAATLDARNNRGTLLTGPSRQFVEYAPIFKKADPYDVASLLPSAQTQASSTVDLKPPSRTSRWEPKTIVGRGGVGGDDLNDREAGFSLDNAIQNIYGGASGLESAGRPSRQIATRASPAL